MSKDLYRDTPVRYLGYANEVGEAFRAFIGSKMVLASYGIATVYVLADTIDKTRKCYQKNVIAPNRTAKTLFTASDTLIWQMLASVMIPGFTINRLCALSTFLLRKSVKLPKTTRRMIVTGIGLGTIPFIIHPIDHLTDEILDNTIRRLEP